MTEKYILIQNTQIFYKITGNGKPVVLIHGFAEDSNVWKYQWDTLSKKYKLIIPDLPGSGRSGMLPDMSIEGLATCISAIIVKETSHQLPVLIGHSMGGYIALAIAAKQPRLICGLGLFHSTAFADSDEKKVARRKSIEFIRTNGSYEFLKQSIPNLFAEAYRTKNGAEIHSMIEFYKDFDPAALIAYYEAMIQRPDRRTLLPSFYDPVLFIIGKNDKAVPFEDSMKQPGLTQLSYIHILENAAHMGMWEEPEKSIAVLEEFLAAVHGS